MTEIPCLKQNDLEDFGKVMEASDDSDEPNKNKWLALIKLISDHLASIQIRRLELYADGSI